MNDRVGILELADACAAMRTRDLELFAVLGGWVASTDAPALQRLFAEACHRHAWHAELWRQRTPTIPGAAVAAQPGVLQDAPNDDSGRGAWYRAALGEIAAELAALGARVDVALDPSTARTLDLVGRDVNELADRLAGVSRAS